MSFGLLTAVTVDDVPRVLRRVAMGYRNVETATDFEVWQRVADEIDAFATELEITIKKARTARVRL